MGLAPARFYNAGVVAQGGGRVHSYFSSFWRGGLGVVMVGGGVLGLGLVGKGGRVQGEGEERVVEVVKEEKKVPLEREGFVLATRGRVFLFFFFSFFLFSFFLFFFFSFFFHFSHGFPF